MSNIMPKKLELHRSDSVLSSDNQKPYLLVLRFPFFSHITLIIVNHSCQLSKGKKELGNVPALRGNKDATHSEWWNQFTHWIFQTCFPYFMHDYILCSSPGISIIWPTDQIGYMSIAHSTVSGAYHSTMPLFLCAPNLAIGMLYVASAWKYSCKACCGKGQ